jgi:palmitoyl-protein thioesterase
MHPNTPVYALDMFESFYSLTPMWVQVEAIIQRIKNYNIEGPFILVGHSQGALLSRAIVQAWPNHPIHTFISLSGPQMGQFGLVPGMFSWIPDNMTAADVYSLVYNTLAQDTLSFANYWHDPFHEQQFLSTVNFLPYINNMTTNPDSKSYKENFLRLKNCVFIGGPSDDVIAPWQSALFGFWNSDQSKIINMDQFAFYQNDYLGLKTLNDTGRLQMISQPGVNHMGWIFDPNVFKNIVLPLLI